MLKRAYVIAGLVALASTPAVGQTFDLSSASSGTTSSSLNFTSGDLQVTLTGYAFANSLGPASLGGYNLSSFTGSILSYSDRGIGVCSIGEPGGATGNSEGCPEVDSADEQGRNATNSNEGLLLSFAGSPTVDLLGAILNRVDQYDTLGIYGVSNVGFLSFLGFTGTIMNPTGGFTVQAVGSNTNTQHELTFAPALTGYSQYFFTTTTNSSLPNRGDGYRLRELTVAAVPEPATWGMMLFGFGFIGMQLRRSRRRLAFAA